MKIRSIILLPLALFAFAACQNLEPEQPGRDKTGKEITFSSSIGAYTKATDNSFETGDIAGLSAGDPVNVSNFKLTYAEGGFTPEYTLYWGLDQAEDKKTTFAAYYPYKESLNPLQAFDWTIPADQSAAGAYAGADLLVAKAETAPIDGTVHLAFSHALSRMILAVENKVEEEEIAEVKMNGVKLAASVDILQGTVTAAGEAQEVIPASDDLLLYYLVAPQTVSPEILITMKSGKVVRYIPDNDLAFASGKQISAAIVVEKDAVSFTAEIMDWVDVDGGHIGKTEDPGVQEHVWSVEYSGELYPFEEQEDGTLHQVFSNGSQYAQIRIIKDEYAEAWGCAIPSYAPWLTEKEPTDVIPLAPNGYFYIQGEGEVFDLVLDLKAKTLTVTLMEHEWESLGTGLFVDGLVSDIFGIPHEEIEVEVLAEKNFPNLIRIKNPYENWSWKDDEFYYEEGGVIDMYIKPDNQVWIKNSYTGLWDDTYGQYWVFSLCDENGWGGYDYYGYYYPAYGFIQFAERAAITLSNYKTLYTNTKGMTSLTLPGYDRPVHYTDFTAEYVNYLDEEGNRHFVITVTPQMDIALMKYGLYAGSLTREEAFGTNSDGLLYTDVIPNGTVIEDLQTEVANQVDIIVPQSGVYTVIYYAENAAGKLVGGRFVHYALAFDGDETPAAGASISAEPAQPLSELQLLATVKFTDPDKVYVLAVPEAEWAESGLTDDDIYDYTMSHGMSPSSNYINAETGINLTFGGLSPETQYRLFVAGNNQFGNAAWAQTTAKTGTAPAFSTVGTGHYKDNFLLNQKWIEEEYVTEVEIQKAETTPVRYRVVAPYDSFWTKYAETVPYSGFHAQAIDFYMDGQQLKYDPYYNGYKEEGYGDIRYYCYNPYTSAFFYTNNRILQEGVYSIAPYANIEGSGYYYDLTGYQDGILIEMPGYSYTPAQAPAKAPARKNLVETPATAGMAVQAEIRPFTRHMLNTGKPKVSHAQHERSQITAEPIK